MPKQRVQQLNQPERNVRAVNVGRVRTVDW